MQYDLSILIPSRNEMFLNRTIEDILSNIRGNTEVIVVLDGVWPEEGIPVNPRVTIVYHPVSVGQRAATNEAARMSKAKYLMKVDAHCSFDEGFDIKMMSEMHDDWTMVPTMYNLHVFDWVCACGNRIYQGPTPDKCNKCGEIMTRQLVWQPRMSRKSTAYRFDAALHFQYWGDLSNREECKGDISPTMSLQGSCFMLTRKKYWELNICDEKYGSWGQQGVEVACKTWLSGGKVMVNKKTWYAHMFRTQGGDFSFPYPLSGRDVEKAREYSRNTWLNNSFDKQIYPLSWLLERFAPIPGWHDDAKGKKVLETVNEAGKKFARPVGQVIDSPTKGIIYYTDNKLSIKIAKKCQKQLLKSAGSIPIVSSSLKSMDFGSKNVKVKGERGVLTMFKQILAALEASDADVVFFCEHDVLYHPFHFDFTPPKSDIWYYNTNVWKVNAETGHAFRVDDCRQVSGICVYRDLAIKHYRERVKRVEEQGYTNDMGYEPGTHNRAGRVDDSRSERWESESPNVDIRHDSNLSATRWSPEEFRNEKYTKGWKESNDIPGWGIIQV